MASFPAATTSSIMDNAHYLEDSDSAVDNYVLQLQGYFIPPSDGDYSFLIKGTDEAKVFFNDGSTTAQVRCLLSQLHP